MSTEEGGLAALANAFKYKPETKIAQKVTSPAAAVEYKYNKSSGTYSPRWEAPANAGGVGTYAYIPDSAGNLVGMDQAATESYRNAVKSTGMTDLSVDGGMHKDLALGAPDPGTDWLGLASLGLQGMGMITDWQQMQTAKDTLKFNKMNANRAYEADKLKYNNALARTEAVNDFYGSKNVATRL